MITVDGSWSLWHSWSICTRSCGGGRKLRIRTCNSPPQFNDRRRCVGDSVNTVKCNKQSCKGDITILDNSK